MKKIKHYLMLGLMGLLIIEATYMVSAWKNGSYANTPSDYDYATDYGTHDWVADSALQQLIIENATKWQWLSTRKNIFLLGTEAPDNSGMSINLDGKNISGFGDTTYHHIYFYFDNQSILEDDAALRAKWCADQADVALTDNKLDQAAFYLGAMTHYIADQAVYCHTTTNNKYPYYVDFDDGPVADAHAKFEGYVNTRTDDTQNREEFFKINNTALITNTPYNLTIILAKNTYFDTEGGHGAKWMYDNFFSTWKTTYATRASDTAIHQEYYNRVEQSLNKGINAVASAIVYVINNNNGNIGDVEPNSSSDTSDNTEEEDIFDSINGYSGFLILMLGSLMIVVKRNQKRTK